MVNLLHRLAHLVDTIEEMIARRGETLNRQFRWSRRGMSLEKYRKLSKDTAKNSIKLSPDKNPDKFFKYF
jgi:hypothetical protein